MADQCIVCLGDLSHSDAAADEAGPSAYSPLSSRAPDESSSIPYVTAIPTPENELVAHLLPCGHDLHDECLRPWVERANSCPICRANFNVVELSNYVGGPCINSYVVQDKQQVADVDPSTTVDDELFGDPDTPCMVCQTSNNEDELLLCDGCNQACHVACAGLDGVPGGAWFCYDCMTDPHILQNAVQSSAQETVGTRRGRTVAARRGPRRRTNARQRARSREWAEVWSRIERRTGIDLDFPFDDDTEDPMDEITRLLTRERDQRWQRRADVATRQGAGARFREAAPSILQSARPRKQPEPESQEELRAWNSFDKSRQLRHDDGVPHGRAGSTRRKRKSPSGSPSETVQQPEPPLKRPRTRRVQESSGDTNQIPGEPSGSGARASDSEQPSAPQPRRERTERVARPSFLSSLLQEVATTPAAAAFSDGGSPHHAEPVNFPQDQSISPRPSSPELSPASSGHATPRSMTPVNFSSPRPGSPPLTSMISPIFPPAPEFSPFSPIEEDSVERARSRVRQNNAESPQPEASSDAPRKQSNHSVEHSPTRSTLSYSTKLEIQRMVKNVLRPLYAEEKIDKEEYTEINKSVSRMLYEKVSDFKGGLEDAQHRREWQHLAHDSVLEAVRALKKTTESTDADTADGTGVQSEIPLRGHERLDAIATASQVEIEQEA